MNWKRIVLYLFLALLAGTAVLAYLAQQNTIKIYGGKTQVVDHKQFAPPQEAICIKDVNVLAPGSSYFLPHQYVYLKNGVIHSIDSSFEKKGDWTSIEGKGKFLIPGLIDSHVHLFKSSNDLLLYLANGVTGIREMIGEEGHLTWRREIENGRPGPDMFIASPRVGSFGKMEGWFMKTTQGYNNISTPKEAESFLKRYKSKGYDAVKIYSQLNRESYDAINRLAPAMGLKIVGHIPWSLGLADIMSSNQTEVAHLEEIMNALRREHGQFNSQEGAEQFLAFVEKRSKELAIEFKANGLAVTTTLWLTKSFVKQKFDLEQVLRKVALPYENPGISEWDEKIPGGLGWLPHINRYLLPEDMSPEDRAWRKIFWETYGEACAVILKVFAKKGVEIMAGTDANLPPTVPGFSLHDELISMHSAGMSPSEVLQAATAVPANWMGKNSGKIAPGLDADLLLLDANPLENIANTKKIRTVVSKGRVYDRPVLDQMLASVREANDKSRTRDISQFSKNENFSLTLSHSSQSNSLTDLSYATHNQEPSGGNSHRPTRRKLSILSLRLVRKNHKGDLEGYSCIHH